ncbi:MAG: acylneuraminate cytidylyltransferase [Methanobacteriota archaeon]|nr:MAG: acylneuraminate cytidylyltransferase [Euryarchaeota archaeon]
MRTVAIIQARMGSTRLPGKVLQPIGDKTMLAHVVTRARKASAFNALVVATTTEKADDAIVRECDRLDVPSFRGNPEDVLDRYHAAARQHRADEVVRITSDCPLLDPEVVDGVVGALHEDHADYASNTVERTFPLGLDAEALTSQALRTAWEQAKKPYERAHVTPYIWQHPDRFRIRQLKAEANFSDHRWTVDTREDLAFVRAVYARLHDPERFGWRDVLELVRADPSLEDLNRHVRPKALEEG